MEREMLPTNIFQLITPCDTCVTACTEADMWFHMSQFQEYSNIPLQHTSDLAGLEFMKRIPFHLTSFKNATWSMFQKRYLGVVRFQKRKFRHPMWSQFLHRLLDLLDLRIRRDFALRRQTLSENHHLIVLAWSYVDSFYMACTWLKFSNRHLNW